MVRKDYMLMEQIIFKGGYGEHGRSCFVVRYSREADYMVDCGVMDTDAFPYPAVSREELSRVKYLFLTHCHKDHAGAFRYFVENGFKGCLIVTQMTLDLSEIQYDNILLLDTEDMPGYRMIDGLEVAYGRSGHCPGSVWFHITSAHKSFFFSGDYQANPYLYRCDQAVCRNADVAIIDCAHNQTDRTAGELRRELTDFVRKMLGDGQRGIFPVPKYGRGMELLYLLADNFPHKRIKVDTEFACCAAKLLAERVWYQSGILDRASSIIEDILKEPVNLGEDAAIGYDIMLIADTHLEKKCNIDFVAGAVGRSAEIIVTGRRKKGSYADELCERHIAHRYLYPHHQSNSDLEKVISDNDFKLVFPFHNSDKRVIIK